MALRSVFQLEQQACHLLHSGHMWRSPPARSAVAVEGLLLPKFHRYASSEVCQWVHCHTKDWKRPQCKNVSYGARMQCNTRWCQHPKT